MNDVMTVLGLATFSTAVGATLCITQYIKPLLPKISARWIALSIALLLMVLVTVANHGDPVAYGIAVVNAALIASSAMGIYETTAVKKLFADKKTDDTGEGKTE